MIPSSLFVPFVLVFVPLNDDVPCPCEWQELQKIESQAPVAHEGFGTSIAADLDVLVVGAPYEPGIGKAYVFRFQNDTWEHEETLSQPGGSTGTEFGHAVAIHGDLIVVGAYNDGEGSAHGFRKPNAGSPWVFEQSFAEHDTKNGRDDEFGWSVAVHENTIAIGARFADTVYLYEKEGMDWGQPTSFSEGDQGDDYGLSVGLSSEHLVVGAPGAATEEGVVYMYSRTGGSSKTLLAERRAPFHYRYGHSLAIKENLLAVGSQSGAGDVGAAWIYRYDGVDWREKRFSASDGTHVNYYGWSVAVDYDAVVVGATNAFGSQGSAYLYRWDGEEWTEQQLRASDGTTSDTLGYSVAITGEEILLGDNTNQVSKENPLPNGGNIRRHKNSKANWDWFGDGSPGSEGRLPTLTPLNCAAIGHEFSIDISNSLGADTTGALFIGVNKTRNGASNPLYVSPLVTLAIPVPALGFTATFDIPNDLSWDGIRVYVQILEVDGGAPGGFSYSRGLDLTLGLGVPYGS